MHSFKEDVHVYIYVIQDKNFSSIQLSKKTFFLISYNVSFVYSKSISTNIFGYKTIIKLHSDVIAKKKKTYRVLSRIFKL